MARTRRAVYNEPHDVPRSVWRSGGATSSGFQAVGMQQLYDTVRATGAQNLVMPIAWDSSWGFLTATDPVIVTEFGDTETACATAYSAALIQYADVHLTSWTAWAWYPGGCSFPALIDDWVSTPSAVGQIVKAALLSYGDASASPPDGGTADGGATQ